MKTTSNSLSNITRHVPQRTCLACRTVRPKRDMVRLVRTESGAEIDFSGKKAGRGAYLCRRPECWETGLKGNRLENTLRGNITRDNREKLLECSREITRGAN